MPISLLEIRPPGFRIEHGNMLLPKATTAQLSSETRRRRPLTALALAGSGGRKTPQSEADLDFSVFRFTLGIPGFPDENIPLVVGTLGAALLAANHAVTPGPVSPAQTRTEVLGVLLTLATSLVPWIGSRLKGARKARSPSSAAGGASADMVFALAQREGGERQKKDMAWATYSLLRNSNTSALLIWARGQVVCARGCWGPLLRKRTQAQTASTNPSPSQLAGGFGASDPRLAQLTSAMEESLLQVKELQEVALGERASLTISRTQGLTGLSPWPVLPDSALTVLALPLRLPQQTEEEPPPQGLLLLCSDVGNAYAAKDRAWVVALAKKLSGVC